MGQPEAAAKVRRTTRWIAVVAVLLLLAGIAAAVQSRRRADTPMAVSETPAGVASLGEADPHAGIPDDETHREALEAEQKSKWVDDVPGLDVSDLSDRQRQVFIAAANTQRCTCGCGYTLAGCRVYDSTCEKSGPRVAALLDSVRAGHVRSVAGLRTPPAHPG